jgi:hypothetical protein
VAKPKEFKKFVGKMEADCASRTPGSADCVLAMPWTEPGNKSNDDAEDISKLPSIDLYLYSTMVGKAIVLQTFVNKYIVPNSIEIQTPTPSASTS